MTLNLLEIMKKMNEAAFNIMKKTKIILVKYHIISIYYHNSTFGTLDNSKLVVFGKVLSRP